MITLILLSAMLIGNFQQPANYLPTTTTLVGKLPKIRESGLLILVPQPQIRGAYTFSIHNGKVQSGAYVRRGMYYRVQFVDIYGQRYFDQLWWLDVGTADISKVKPVEPKWEDKK